MINPTSSIGKLGVLNPSTDFDHSNKDPENLLENTDSREDYKQLNEKPSAGSSAASQQSEKRAPEKMAVNEKHDTFKKSLKTAIHDKKVKQKSATEETQSQAGAAAVNTPQAPKVEDKPAIPAQRSVENTVPAIPITFDGDVQEADEIIDTAGEVSAVIRFMQTMEQEFGIDPKKLIAAMASAQAQMSQSSTQGLPIQVMNRQTQNQFFKELGLKGTDIKRAEFLYQTMLKEMAQDSMATTVRETGKEVDVALLSPAMMKRQEMGRSVDSMQKSFFMGDKPVYGKMAPAEANPVATQGLEKTDANQSNKAAGIDAATFSIGGTATNTAAASAKAAGATSASATAVPVTEMKTETATNFWNQPLAPQKATAAAGVAGKAAATGEATAATAADASGSASVLGADLAAALGNFSIGTSSDDSEKSDASADGKGSGLTDGSKSDRSTALDKNSAVDSFAMQLNGAKADPITGAVSATAPSNVDRPEDVMNVRSLIQSAQVLLRQGGGEMKVQMNPEGLGQVDLKVNVNDGKVEVQILAETADTKRLLEKNITDLRSSLSGHKLEVSDLKVDMAKAPEKDSNQTNNSDFNRDQARQFLGQFRDERDAMRNGMFELPNMRQYKPSKAKDIQPTTNSSEEKPATKGSNRLNVVV